MKTVFVTLSGEPKPGINIFLEHSHRVSGGRSSMRFDIKPSYDAIHVVDGVKTIVEVGKITLEQVVNTLVERINSLWTDGFQARVRNDHEFIIQCSDACSLCMFKGYTEGPEGVTVNVEEIGG